MEAGRAVGKIKRNHNRKKLSNVHQNLLYNFNNRLNRVILLKSLIEKKC